jgi:hypothetical protein
MAWGLRGPRGREDGSSSWRREERCVCVCVCVWRARELRGAYVASPRLGKDLQPLSLSNSFEPIPKNFNPRSTEELHQAGAHRVLVLVGSCWQRQGAREEAESGGPGLPALPLAVQGDLGGEGWVSGGGRQVKGLSE